MDRAVRAARAAFRRRWGALPGTERAKYLFRIARILQERSREFAVLESMDSGKPIKESRDVDVPLAAAHFWYYAGWADKLDYAFPGRVARPLGVAGQIIPWNFPLLMLAWKIAPALAAGNTVVLKPASTTPLTALLFADVCRQADLPPGVVNIVPGPGEVGMALVRNPGVDKIAFTGSTEIGRRIAAGVAGSDKALTLELGGKAANIVFDDAPLDQAIEGIVNGIYFNQGEVCCAGSRLLVQESIAEPLIDKLKDRLATIRVGDPLDKNTDVGAINSRSQLEKITELVASGLAEGADMYQPACDLPERGYFFRPTLPNALESPDRPGDLGRLSCAHLPDARRGGREGQQHGHGLSAGSDGPKAPGSRDGRQDARRRRRRIRSIGSTRRVAFGWAGRPASGAGGLHGCWPTSASRSLMAPHGARHQRAGTASSRATPARLPPAARPARLEVRKTWSCGIGARFRGRIRAGRPGLGSRRCATRHATRIRRSPRRRARRRRRSRWAPRPP
jgi:hypothetical protein